MAFIPIQTHAHGGLIHGCVHWAPFHMEENQKISKNKPNKSKVLATNYHGDSVWGLFRKDASLIRNAMACLLLFELLINSFLKNMEVNNVHKIMLYKSNREGWNMNTLFVELIKLTEKYTLFSCNLFSRVWLSLEF